MKKILIVDDEFDISEAITLILRGEGYDVDTCADGKEALDYLQGKKMREPAMIFLDVMMPYVSGLDVLAKMKTTPRLAKVPVVLMSAAPVSVKQSDYGWVHFLRKPFNLDALIELVNEYAGPPVIHKMAR